MRRIALACLIFATAPLLAQPTPVVAPVAPVVWVTITQESPTIEVTLPAGTIYRLGDYTNNRWSANTTANELGADFSPLSMGTNAATFPFADPDPGTVKELDVLEVAAPQTITVSDLTLSPLAPIQRIIPGLVPPTTLATPPGSQHTLTFSNFLNTGTDQNALMVSLTNAPADLAYRTWEGTQMELDVDGVAFVCSFGQTYTDETYTLSCTVPVATP